MRPAHALAFGLLIAPLPAAAQMDTCDLQTHGVSVGRVITESTQIYIPGQPLIAGTKYSVDVTFTNPRTFVYLTLAVGIRFRFTQTLYHNSAGTTRIVLGNARGEPPTDAVLQRSLTAVCTAH